MKVIKARVRLIRRNFLRGVLVFSAVTGLAGTVKAEESRAVILLDTTAQMSATFGQKRKIDWAKAAIVGAASRMDAGRPLGLWAFGSVPEKKCEDMRELVPIQAAGQARSALTKAFTSLQPRAARSPVMDSLQAALASAAPMPEKPVSTYLIAGTGDDCVGDICAAAKRLHDRYPDAKLTVFGLAMGEQAAANFTCAAKAMGGNFTAVRTGADLERTLRDALGESTASAQEKPQGATNDAPSLANTAQSSAVAPANAAAEAPSVDQPKEAPPSAQDQSPAAGAEEKGVIPPRPEPNVVLSAALVDGMPALEAGVTWEIYKVQLTPTGQLRVAESPLWVGGGTQAKAKLPEGRYSVRAEYGLATGSGEFTLGSDKIEKTIALDAGTIVAEAQQSPGGPPLDNPFFIISRQKPSGEREEIARSSGAPALFHLNAGDYVLSAFGGSATRETPVKVLAGKVSVVRLSLDVGTIEIKTFAKEGATDPISAWHRLSSETKKQGAPFFQIFGSDSRLLLPEGRYRLDSTYGDVEVESTVTVRAGETTQQNVVFNAGEARLSLPPDQTDAVCSVYDAGSDLKGAPISRAVGAEISFRLKAGHYKVECAEKGEKGEKTPLKETDISVVAGEVQDAKLHE